MAQLIKIVRQTPDGLASCIMGQPGLEQIYVPGQWHAAQIGGFFTFDSTEHAMAFYNHYFEHSPSAQLWHAECLTGHILPNPPRTPGSGVRESHIQKFWNDWLKYGTIPDVHVLTWPGTVIVKRICLIERITMSEIGQKGDSK